jgi:DNA modification methylase
MPKDVVLILFGGSGSEIEVCKFLDRQYISAEIDKKYYEIIVDRLKKGKIDEKHRLKMKKERIDNELQLTFLED